MKNLKNASGNFNELLFENRNKNYGAYVIRKEYNENLIKSFFAAMLSMLLCAGIFAMLNRKNAGETIIPTKQDFEQVKIEIDLRDLTPQKVVTPLHRAEAKPAAVKENTNVVALVKNELKLLEETKTVDNTPGKIATPSNLNATQSEIFPTSESGISHADKIPGSNLENSIKSQAELDVQPEFPGGYKKLMDYLSRTIVYPMSAKENEIKGTVYVSFKVDERGKVSEVKLVRGLYSACDAEVLRVVKSFPDWKPGIYQGRNVSVLFSLPVTFDLRN
jgi:protein TonB